MNKRKEPPLNHADNGAWRNKRQKVQRDARTLSVQTTSKAFKNGELDVGAFVKAREYEIKALEEGLARSRKALTQRAFQQVPKELRRRTASHNVKRVPKRLRKQAVKEMSDDNTPVVTARRRKLTRHMRLRMETVKRLRALGAKGKSTEKVGDGGGKVKNAGADSTLLSAAVTATPIKTRLPRIKKNVLDSAPLPPAKFRKRQIHKTWLPTHLYHAKRARMTAPKEPLWRFAIPLTSTVKSYRPTHRASKDRGAIAWDTSYMSSISLEGAENSIQGVLRALGVGMSDDAEATWGPRGQKWRNGTRTWQGWLYERDAFPTQPVAPATVIWRAEVGPLNAKRADESATKQLRRQIIIRVHPSAFLQLWEQISRLAKVQKPQVVATDLRFELGSIEIVGPGSTEALLGALWPSTSHIEKDSVEDTWKKLVGIDNPAVLPSNTLLSFDVSDPRLHHPPRTVQLPSKQDQDLQMHILAHWPCDAPRAPSGLFSRNIRQAACRSLQSQKTINRRKAAADPGNYPEPVPEDPKIPVLLFPSTQRIHSSPRAYGGSGRQSTWTLLLPWKAVPAVWQSIMYYPLSTGGQVRLGGLDEQRQVAFENGLPWFPGDFPGTKSGDAWEADESLKRRKTWERRPRGKRIEWSSVALGVGRKGEIGDGCACDWAHLVTGVAEVAASATGAAAPVSPPPQPPASTQGEPLSNTANKHPENLIHISSSVAQSMARGKGQPAPPLTNVDAALVNVRVTFLTRGVPTPCARIYRLPGDEVLRSLWLSLDPLQKNSRVQKKAWKRDLPSSLFRGVPQSAVKERLAQDLLRPPHDPALGDGYPEVPGEEDLIGFVTKGEFCLTEGMGVGIGSVIFQKLARAGHQAGARQDYMCIVRNAGEGMGRLARWEMI
ncbi:hypothetical protein MBLNU459_g5658t1 [Dothideomycetes sp. NU459]